MYPESHVHCDCLLDWLKTGSASSLAKCREFLAAGTPCTMDVSDHGAAIAFICTEWPRNRADEIASLMASYIQAGLIDVSVNITHHLNRAPESWVGQDFCKDQHPLVFAIRNKHLRATLALACAGAVEVTDFSLLLLGEDPLLAGNSREARQAAFERLMARTWDHSPELQALVRAARMTSLISQDLGSSDSAEVGKPAPSRRGGI